MHEDSLRNLQINLFVTIHVPKLNVTPCTPLFFIVDTSDFVRAYTKSHSNMESGLGSKYTSAVDYAVSKIMSTEPGKYRNRYSDYALVSASKTDDEKSQIPHTVHVHCTGNTPPLSPAVKNEENCLASVEEELYRGINNHDDIKDFLLEPVIIPMAQGTISQYTPIKTSPVLEAANMYRLHSDSVESEDGIQSCEVPELAFPIQQSGLSADHSTEHMLPVDMDTEIGGPIPNPVEEETTKLNIDSSNGVFTWPTSVYEFTHIPSPQLSSTGANEMIGSGVAPLQNNSSGSVNHSGLPNLYEHRVFDILDDHSTMHMGMSYLTHPVNESPPHLVISYLPPVCSSISRDQLVLP